MKTRVYASPYNHFVTCENGETLAFNSVSESLALLNPEALQRYAALCEGAELETENQLDVNLLSGRFLLEDVQEEKEMLKQNHFASRNDSSAWSLTICPTIACNFACDYCFQRHHPGKMKPAVQDALMEMIESKLPTINYFSVTWYGGEPTLAWDVIESLSQRILALCEKYDVHYEANMISNGYLLNLERIRQLPELKINAIQITLDGESKEHDKRRILHSGKGTFSKILANLEHFKSHRHVQISIRMNVDKRNKASAHALIDELADAGFANRENIHLYFAPVDATTEPAQAVVGFCMARKSFADLEPELYAHAIRVGLATQPFPSAVQGVCIAARPEEYVVQADGELHKCWDTVGQPEFAVGHLLKESFRNAPYSPTYKRWMDWSPFSEDLSCNSCSWLPSCMGGCPLKAVYPELSQSGKIELNCVTHKYNYEIMLPMFVSQTHHPEPQKELVAT